MKRISVAVCFLLFFLGATAQDVKIKKGTVLIDGNAVYKIEREPLGAHFYSLKTGEEVLFIYVNNNGTIEIPDDNYTEIKFISLSKSLEVDGVKTLPNRLEWIIKNKAINLDGTLSEENVDKLIKNYDDEITKRTIIAR